MLESGIDPATVRFEVSNFNYCYCKYIIFLLGARATPPGIIELPIEIYYIYSS